MQEVDPEIKAKVEQMAGKVANAVGLVTIIIMLLLMVLAGSAICYAIVLIWRAINGGQ